MGPKKVNAVEMKRQLQSRAEKELSGLSESEQLDLLKRIFGHLKKKKIA